jgi:hypothetical protein
VPREHVTEGYDCWCKPEVLAVCPECEGSEAGCWKCVRGFLQCKDPASYDGPHRLLIIHHDVSP